MFLTDRAVTNEGFIVIWRKMGKTSFYKDSQAVHLALHLIMKANHETTKFIFNNMPMELARGQCIVGRLKLAEETGMAPSTIRNKLKLLKNAGFLDIKPDSQFSIVTICKYNDYQDIKIKGGQQKGQPEDSERTTGGHIQPYNNDNNLTKKIVFDSNFVSSSTKTNPVSINKAFNNIDEQMKADREKMERWKAAAAPMPEESRVAFEKLKNSALCAPI